MTRSTGVGRGGRRPHSGSFKPGNKAAVKSGEYSRDPRFSLFWQSLTEEQQDFFRPIIRARGEELPGFAELLTPAAADVVEDRGNVTPITSARRRQPSNTDTQGQTIKRTPTHRAADTEADRRAGAETRFAGLVDDLVVFRVLGAADFAQRHRRRWTKLEAIVSEIKQLQHVDPVAYAAIANPAGTIVDQFHKSIAQTVGRAQQCPYCAAKWFIMALADPAEEDLDFEDDAEQQEAK